MLMTTDEIKWKLEGMTKDKPKFSYLIVRLKGIGSFDVFMDCDTFYNQDTLDPSSIPYQNESLKFVGIFHASENYGSLIFPPSAIEDIEVHNDETSLCGIRFLLKGTDFEKQNQK